MPISETHAKSVLKCTRCGNCQYFCPSFTVSRSEPFTARGRLQLVKSRLGGNYEACSDLYIKRMNQCLMCGNCSLNCPAGIKTEEIMEAVRASCIEEKGISGTMELTRSNIDISGSITGDSPKNRLLWLTNIEGETRDMKFNMPADYVYFTGCVPALYPSSYSIPQAFVRILKKAGLDFTLIGDRENCCGYPLAIGGLPHEAKKSAQKNVANLKSLGAKYLITTCPSCYHMWKEYYPGLLGYTPELELIHGTQLLQKLAAGNQLKLKEINRTVTYHDPCDLGRKSGIYDEPRNILKSIPGLTLKEMKHTREDARCCGGGGNLEMNDSSLSGKVAQERVRQALDTGADTIVTACQQCKRTLMGGARHLRARIKVLDISELLLEAML